MGRRRVAALLSCAGVVGGTLVSAVVVPSAGALPPVSPIYLVSSSTTVPAGDVQVKARLEATGHPVTVVDDDAVSAAGVADGALVVVSSSVVVTKVGAKLANVDVPLLSWEAFLFDDNKLATVVGESATTTRKIKMASSSHAHGLTGEPLVYASPSKVSYGLVPASAVKVANVVGTPHRAVVFWYDNGALRTDGSPAPQCRAGFFADYAGANKLSTNGVTLFDGLVADLLACNTPPPPVDTDGDGLTDDLEPIHGCDDELEDTDGDLLLDGEEVNIWGTDCALVDTDGDQLDDNDELALTCDPTNPDSDSDGLQDGEEATFYGSDCNADDTDNDGLGDFDETVGGCDLGMADTDGDGIDDVEEVDNYGTECSDPDTDGDGLDDGEELDEGTDPLDEDSDADELSDGDEVHVYSTDPNDADTDDGGVEDGPEVDNGTDPLDGSDDSGCPADRNTQVGVAC